MSYPTFDMFQRSVWLSSGGSPSAAPSTIYAYCRALPLLAALSERGLIDAQAGRDLTTGRKVSSIVQEVARLSLSSRPSQVTEPPSPADMDALVAVYLHVHTWKLADVRELVRGSIVREPRSTPVAPNAPE